MTWWEQWWWDLSTCSTCHSIYCKSFFILSDHITYNQLKMYYRSLYFLFCKCTILTHYQLGTCMHTDANMPISAYLWIILLSLSGNIQPPWLFPHWEIGGKLGKNKGNFFSIATRMFRARRPSSGEIKARIFILYKFISGLFFQQPFALILIKVYLFSLSKSLKYHIIWLVSIENLNTSKQLNWFD